MSARPRPASRGASTGTEMSDRYPFAAAAARRSGSNRSSSEIEDETRIRPSAAARKSGLWFSAARSSKMRPRSAGSSYAPTASSRPLEGTSTAAELPPSASAAAWAIASRVASRDSDCPRTDAIR